MANKFFQEPFLVATSSGNLAQTASSGGGSNATITLSAAPSSADRRTIRSVTWSYSTTPPSSGYIRVYNGTSSGALIFGNEVTQAGYQSHTFSPPLAATPGNAITAILTQAGSSVIGYLQAYGPVV